MRWFGKKKTMPVRPSYSPADWDARSLLRSTDKEIREAAYAKMTAAFTLTRNMNDLYKYSSHFDAINEFEIGSPQDLLWYEQHFTPEQCFVLFAAASFNHSGYVREEAVKRLVRSGNGAAIPLLIYRMADWVPVIRERAREGLKDFQKSEFVAVFIENLHLVEWMKTVGRVDLKPFCDSIMRFLTQENEASVIGSFRNLSDSIRGILARYMISDVTAPETLRLFLRDRCPHVRVLALRQFDQLTTAEVERLLQDKSGKVRRHTFYGLDETRRQQAAPEFLTDEYAMLRNMARSQLKDSEMDFAAHYHAHLAQGKNVCAALLGLAEVGGTPYATDIAPYLDSPRVRVVKAAFRAAQPLLPDAAFRFALEHLGDERNSIRDIAINYLSENVTSEVLICARSLYQKGDMKTRRAMLKLFDQIGRWTALSDIVLALVDDEAGIRALANKSLKKWRFRAANLYSTPNEAERIGIQSALLFAKEKNARQNYFAEPPFYDDKNPLQGLDFYLQ
jgi:HEAT repeat protein